MTSLSFRICSILLLLPALSVRAEHVKGLVGGRVTLPCTYSVTGVATSKCWGRGHCPKSKCLDEILLTDSDGKKVIWNQTERYRLLGNITQGDVSLTISQLTLSDSGTYCCRVEIPGLFNDLKVEIQVRVAEGSFGEDQPLKVSNKTVFICRLVLLLCFILISLTALMLSSLSSNCIL
ncbi:hepatitis A virus cellular receptor 1 homolog [Xenopus laevis]|uniref:Hepatitis A virus cellular receptor 1 homolog n=1 Tax=Xenopus laevis TaxID=8355 RepID=A0A8J1MJG3_XENLA|nr:hepatitis A virus cellular receptor 1 homolog [Xenopus laevis]OCT57811.1 hypothetical protein XELAEV_18002991mg [Xenopus laevis]